MTTEASTRPATRVEPLRIADRTFESRLILGTGKYSDPNTMLDAFETSGTEMITVALRRVPLDEIGKGSLIDQIDQEKYSCCPTPPPVSPPTRRSAPSGWRESWAAGTGSSWR